MIERFPKLPLLEEFCEYFSGPRLELALKRTVLVSVQHLLETTGSLFNCLVDMGLDPQRIFALGKVYSTNARVRDLMIGEGLRVIEPSAIGQLGRYDEVLRHDVARMWQLVLRATDWNSAKHLVVLDDGGYAVRGIPLDILKNVTVVGIEQTMSGLAPYMANDSSSIPIIEVASSAAKKYIEAPMIREATFAKLEASIFRQKTDATFGVIGLGNIGAAIASGLLARKKNVAIFDKDAGRLLPNLGTAVCGNAKEVFESSDVVFGCTGSDITEDADWWQQLRGKKLFVSCSSQDREFASILRAVDHTGPVRPLHDVVVPLKHGEITVARGGFPANFDGSCESVPRADIQMTRGLLLAAVLQALSAAHRASGREKLDSESQRFIVSRWIERQPHRLAWYEPGLLERFKDLDWIEKNSGAIRNEACVAADANGSSSFLI